MRKCESEGGRGGGPHLAPALGALCPNGAQAPSPGTLLPPSAPSPPAGGRCDAGTRAWGQAAAGGACRAEQAHGPAAIRRPPPSGTLLAPSGHFESRQHDSWPALGSATPPAPWPAPHSSITGPCVTVCARDAGATAGRRLRREGRRAVRRAGERAQLLRRRAAHRGAAVKSRGEESRGASLGRECWACTSATDSRGVAAPRSRPARCAAGAADEVRAANQLLPAAEAAAAAHVLSASF